MGSIWQEIQNPVWWFTAVIAGVLLNMLAAYLKEWADKVGGSLSARRRLRRTETEVARKSRVLLLAGSSDAVGEARQEELRMMFYAVIFLLCSVQGFVLVIGVDFDPFPTDVIDNRTAKAIAMFGASLAMVISLGHSFTAARIKRELRDAREFRERPRSEDKQPVL